MEQYKLMIEIQELRKEVKELKKEQTKGSAIAAMSLFLAIGLSIFLYSINVLNQVLNIDISKISIGTAIVMAVFSMGIMFGAIYIPVALTNRRKKRN